MVDWKRCYTDLDPLAGACYQRFGKPPCDFLVDNKFNHYAAQQNLYATILDLFYNIRLSTMWLLQFHEERQSYSMHAVPRFFNVATVMLDIVSKPTDDPLGGGSGSPSRHNTPCDAATLRGCLSDPSRTTTSMRRRTPQQKTRRRSTAAGSDYEAL